MSSQRNRKNVSRTDEKKDSRAPASERVPDEPVGNRPILGSRVKNDLIGLAIVIVAAVLLVILLVPSQAIGAQVLADGLRLAFGQGALILAIFLLCWSVTYFVRGRLTNSPIRLAVGLGLIFLAIVSILAAMTPQAPSDPSRIFIPASLVAHGGYLGGAVAWVLLTLVGQVPTIIILAGLIVGGLVLIGFSITGLVDWIIRSLKKTGMRDKGTPLPGSLPADGARTQQNGSAYQMGPQSLGNGAGASGRHSGGVSTPSRRYAGGVGGMGESQLAATLYRPNEGFVGDGASRDFSGLGSVRRRIAREETTDGVDPQAKTMVFGKDDPFGADDLQAQKTLVFGDEDLFGEGESRSGDSQDAGDMQAQTTIVFGADDPSRADAPHAREPMVFGEDDSTGSDDPQAQKTLVFGRDDPFGADPAGKEAGSGYPGDRSATPADAGKGKAKKAGKKKRSGKAETDGTHATTRTACTLPSMKLLRVSREKAKTKAGASELRATANRLQETLEEFRVDGEVVGWIAGPTVTLYKLSLGEGVRLNRITALQSDIQLALAAQAIRIVAPIPGTSLVGIEIPNAARNEVLLGDVLDEQQAAVLALAIGKDVEGESIIADLASMPHLLIGGTTGSGKSVAINSIIMSLLMRTTPEEVRMIMIDPKRVELTLYNGIPHLYVPVVTDAGQAASALAWCVAEMDRRLKIFERHTVKNIKQFNTRVKENLEKLEQEAENEAAPHSLDDGDGAGGDHSTFPGQDAEQEAEAGRTVSAAGDGSGEEADIATEQESLRATLPYLVIVIDELADLMMLNGKEVEGAISRLAQLARAAGLHLVVATQRPSTNVITGLIKANIVNRIAFTVASSIDSRVILDTPGAEDLIGMGDMLFSRPEYSKPIRIQGCFVSEPEIETVVDYWRSQGETDYHEEILLASASPGSAVGGVNGGDGVEDDPLLWEAAEIVVSAQLGSTSTLQRRLKVGYARAGRIMDMLEMKGVVGPPNGSKPREVLVDDVLDLESLRAFE